MQSVRHVQGAAMLTTRFTDLSGTIPLHRFEGTFAVTKNVTGAIAAMPHWAGESVGAVRRIQPAAEIIHELVDEAETLLRRWC
jgi:hypothetical protein